LTDQSGSSCPGFQAPHPLAQGGVVAFELLNPPVELCVGEVDGGPGFSESCLHLLFKTVESLFYTVEALVDVGDAFGDLADFTLHSFHENPHMPAGLGKLGLQLILGRHLVEATLDPLEALVNLVELLPDELDQGREVLLFHAHLPLSPAIMGDVASFVALRDFGLRIARRSEVSIQRQLRPIHYKPKPEVSS